MKGPRAMTTLASALATQGGLEVGRWVDVEPIHCHQRLTRNTLVAKVRVCSRDFREFEGSFRIEPGELSFFFDHAIDHLPGMLQINAARQLVLAAAHLIYHVPMDYAALLGWLRVSYLSFAEVGTPTFGRGTLKEYQDTKYQKVFIFDGLIFQPDSVSLTLSGQLLMLHPRLARSVRRRKHPLPAELI